MCDLFFLYLMKFFILFITFTLFTAAPLCAQRSAKISTANQALAQQAQTLREIQYTLQSFSARIEALEQQQAMLNSRISALERNDGGVTKDDLAAVRADLNALKNEQGKLRGDIVADLSTKIKTIADKQRAATESQAKQKSGYTHVVEAGQTISAIAQAYKVSVTSIMKANKIKDATKIRVGQELFIPDP